MLRICLLTALAMLAFAGNSILCRLALKGGHIDPFTFTALRLASGACVLAALAFARHRAASMPALQGSWFGAVFLFTYATAFSLAYVGMDVGPGALLLFAAVQISMLAYGRFKGERLGLMAIAGLILGLCGLGFLLLPGSTAPPLGRAILMVVAGIAWGAYTLHGRGAPSPIAATSGNFIRATPLAGAAALLFISRQVWDVPGLLIAATSGAVTSGLGYVIWYGVVRELTVTRASIVQLSVPVISVLAGVMWLQETLSLRIILSCLAVLGGIGIVLVAKAR